MEIDESHSEPKIEIKNNIIDENINIENNKNDLYKLLENIKLDEINKIRNFLDRKEEELIENKAKNKIIDNSNEKLVGETDSKQIGEVNIEKKITQEELNNETYEVEYKLKSKENKIEESEKSEEYKEVEIDSIKNKAEPILEKIKNIFGEENVFFDEDKKSTYENLNYRNLYYIGIRKKDEFKNPKSHWAEENSWFVKNIKKLEELKQFKVLESKEGLKDLLFDIDSENSIILSFKTTDKLKDESSFEFPIM